MTKYIYIYGNIILKARLENREKGKGIYYESHHIYPSALGGSNKSNNLILLTAREHYICHWLLYNHFKKENNIIARDKMAYAWNMMTVCSNGKRYNSHSFQYARDKMAKLTSKRLKGKKKSEYTKKKMLLAQQKKVIQYDKYMKEIQTFDSIKIAGIKNNIQPSSISRVCNGKRKTAGGFIWKFTD